MPKLICVPLNCETFMSMTYIWTGEVYSTPLQTFTVEKASKVNLNSLTIIAKKSILVAWMDPKFASVAG